MKKFFTPFAKHSSSSSFWILIFGELLVFLAYWNYLTPVNIPKPLEILTALSNLWDNGAAIELLKSFSTNVQAVAISTVLSLFISYFSVLLIGKPIAEMCSKFRFSGLTGYTFLFTIMFGGGESLKLSLLVFGMSVFFITSMLSVIDDVIEKEEELEYARTLRMGEWKVLFEVIIFGKLDQALKIMAQNAAIGWMMLTAVEGLVRSGGGIGTVLLDQNRHFHLSEIFAIQIAILVLGLGQDAIAKYARVLICPYVKGRE